jgi:hypothetical protein
MCPNSWRISGTSISNYKCWQIAFKPTCDGVFEIMPGSRPLKIWTAYYNNINSDERKCVVGEFVSSVFMKRTNFQPFFHHAHFAMRLLK